MKSKNYLLTDLDEFKIRYVKNRIKNKLYIIDSDNEIIIECYKDENNTFNHKFIVTDSIPQSADENILSIRKLKNDNIYEIVSSPSLNISKNSLYLFNWRLNKLFQYLSLDENCANYKDDKYLSWLYHIDLKELEKIRKIYFYDKSIIPFENLSIEELNLEYETIPYFMDNEFEIDHIPENNRLKNTINEIKKRQGKSKVKAKDIYTK